MSSGSDADSGLPAVRDDDFAAVQGHLNHAYRFRDSSHAANVRLHHVNASPFHEFLKLEASLEPLAGSNSDLSGVRQLFVTLQVIGGQRSFNKKDVVFFQTADDPEGFLPIRPAIRHVDHQRHGGPGCFPACRHQFHNGVVSFVQAIVRIGALDANLQLGSPVAKTLRPAHFFEQALRYSLRVQPSGIKLA